jgi:predicted DCC family thiol-disulfide oxidoreductase YuxK
MAGDEEVYIVYDGECPVCSNYTRMVRLREAVGRVTILNAREDHEVVREIKRQGYDLDEGMVLKIGNDIHFGADAMHMMAMLGDGSGLFARVNYGLFHSRCFSMFIYPILRSGRVLILKILGRKKING